MPDSGQYNQFPIDWQKLNASKVPYSNATSGLSATDVQNAIDELKTEVDAKQETLTAGDGIDITSNVISTDNDATLTSEVKPAQAKAVGDALTAQETATEEALYTKAPVITDTASGAIASFPDGADGVPVKDLQVSIEAVQEGSGDPSPDNVRPITGWSEAKVTRTGKNLYSRELSEYNVPVFSTNGTSQSYPDVAVWWIKVKPNTAYAVSGTTPSGQVFYIRWINCDENKGFISRPGGTYTSPALPLSFTTPSNCEWVQIAINQYNVGYLNKNDWLVQVEEGLNASDYEPYNGQTFTIDLDGTRYGCVLDVRRGKLRVDRIYIDASEKTWNYQNSAGDTKVFNFGIATIRETGLISNRFSTNIPSGTPGRMVYDGIQNFYVAFPASEISANTDAAVKTWLAANPTYFVATLKTPIEVDLTPTEITTLLGLNNIWADTGDVSVDYCADTKRYIQKLISQLA
jgi:hypothetical protein